MSFSDTSFEDLLPPYLSNPDKNRLKEGLTQFFDTDHRQKEKRYDHFYLNNPPAYFMQGDLFNSLPVYDWDFEHNIYITGYSPVILVSNSCDVSSLNDRLLQKEALFAHIIPLQEYFSDLMKEGYSQENITTIKNNLMHQAYSNLFYLPPNPIDGIEFIVFFDKVFWHPSENFSIKLKNINDERFLSLNYFGFYLFILKISYHFCRIPEESDRTPVS